MAVTMPELPTPANGEDAAAATDGVPATRPAASSSRRRRWGVNALIVFTTLLAIVSMFAIYANRLLFSADNWASTSTQLLANPDVRSATASYVVDQVYANYDVTGLIKSGLPKVAEPLAAPAAGALRTAAVQATEVALERPRVQDLWENANRTAAQTWIDVVEGKKGPIGTQAGVVTLDLGALANNVASRLGISIPASAQAKLGKITILKSKQLKAVQDVANGVRSLAWWLTGIVPILYGLAIYLAKPGRRRRAVLKVGFAILLSGVVVLWGRDVLITQVNASLVKDQSLRPAGEAVMSISTQILNEIATAFVLVGAVLVASAWFAGPARLATACRRAMAPFMRDHAGWAYTITASVMILVFIINPIPATGKPVGMLVFLGLALFGTEVLRRQIAEEHPDAEAGETMAAFRSRLTSLGSGRQSSGPASTAGTPTDASLTAQLERLAELRSSGALTSEEYDAAKANLLQT
jgi:hypothetical protein